MLGVILESVKHFLSKDMRESAAHSTPESSRSVVSKLFVRKCLVKYINSSPQTAERAMIAR
jgi:hypothetical protein